MNQAMRDWIKGNPGRWESKGSGPRLRRWPVGQSTVSEEGRYQQEGKQKGKQKTGLAAPHRPNKDIFYILLQK